MLAYMGMSDVQTAGEQRRCGGYSSNSHPPTSPIWGRVLASRGYDYIYEVILTPANRLNPRPPTVACVACLWKASVSETPEMCRSMRRFG